MPTAFARRTAAAVTATVVLTLSGCADPSRAEQTATLQSDVTAIWDDVTAATKAGESRMDPETQFLQRISRKGMRYSDFDPGFVEISKGEGRVCATIPAREVEGFAPVEAGTCPQARMYVKVQRDSTREAALKAHADAAHLASLSQVTGPADMDLIVYAQEEAKPGVKLTDDIDRDGNGTDDDGKITIMYRDVQMCIDLTVTSAADAVTDQACPASQHPSAP